MANAKVKLVQGVSTFDGVAGDLEKDVLCSITNSDGSGSTCKIVIKELSGEGGASDEQSVTYSEGLVLVDAGPDAEASFTPDFYGGTTIEIIVDEGLISEKRSQTVFWVPYPSHPDARIVNTPFNAPVSAVNINGQADGHACALDGWANALRRASLGAFATDAIGTAATEGPSVLNRTAAALGAQQYSPVMVLGGKGWDSGASASRDVRFGLQTRPVQGNPVTGELHFLSNINAAGYNSRGKVNSAGLWTLPQLAVAPAASSGAPGAHAAVTAPAHMALTASTEYPQVVFDLSATQTWVAGDLALQRAFRVRAPTYDIGAHTLTRAATVSISGAPAAGGSTTITNAYALDVESGDAHFAGSVLVEVTGDPADNIDLITLTHAHAAGVNDSVGSAILFQAANNAGTAVDVGRVAAQLFDGTPGAEYSQITFSLMSNGGGLVQNLGITPNAVYTSHGIIGSTILTGGIQLGEYGDSGDWTKQIEFLAFTTPPTTFGTSCVVGRLDTGLRLQSFPASTLKMGISSNTQLALTENSLALTPSAVGSGSPAACFVLTPPAHNALTTTTEFSWVHWQSATWTWAAGAIATERFIRIGTPTIAFGGPSTVTKAVTFSIAGAPAAGTFATITNSYALEVESGTVKFAGDLVVGGTIIGGGASAHVIRNDAGDFTARAGLHFLTADFNVTDDSGNAETDVQLATTGVSAATYTYATVQVDAKGRVISASNGTTPALASRTLTMSNTDLTIDGDSSADLSANRTLALASTLAAKTIKGLTVAPDAAATPSTSVLTVTPPAHTAIATTTQLPWVDVGAATWTWAAGTVAAQRFIRIGTPTVAFASASTMTTAATLAIAAAPAAGANATITNAYALWVEGGSSKFDGTVLTQQHSPTADNTYSVGLTGAQFVDGWFTGVLYSRYSKRNQTGSAQIEMGAAGVLITTSAQSSGVPQAFTVTGAAHTGLTASTEVSQVDLNVGQTYTWATGALTTQRFVRVMQPTVAFAGASTLTTAYTVAIDGAPVEGSNATLTKSWALGVNGTAQSSGVPGLLVLGGAAHTTMRASTENNLALFDFAQTYQWAAGAITSQRFFRVSAPTLGFVGASTVSDVYTVWVDAPVAGTNATLTRAAALGLNATVVGTAPIVLDKTMSAAVSNRYMSFRRNQSTVVANIDSDASDRWIMDSGANGFRLAVNGSSTMYSDPSNGSIVTYPSQPQLQFAFGQITTSGGPLTVASNNATDLGQSSARWRAGYLCELIVTDVAVSSGTSSLATLTGAAHTGMTQNTEVTQVDININQTYQWSGGAAFSNNQRFVRIRQPTVAMSSSQTFAEASTVYIDGAPVKGTNISNSPIMYALNVRGYTYVSDNNVGGGLGVGGLGAQLNVQQGAASSPAGGIALSPVYVSSGGHTGITGGDSTRWGTVAYFDPSTSMQFATGNLTSVMAVNIGVPTYAFVGASTITNAATLYIENAPTAGTNATLTNAWAIWVDAGNVRLDGDLLINGNVGFYTTAPVAKPTVTGSRGGNAALASLLTALNSQGLVTDSSSA